MNLEKPLWKRRLSVVEGIYSHLIFSEINNKYPNSKSNNNDFLKSDDWGTFEKDIFNNYLENKEVYTNKLSSLLRSDWTLDRLNMVVLCILYEAISEFYAHNTPMPVLIEQSVKTAKNYCEENEYKLVNAILENCLGNKYGKTSN